MQLAELAALEPVTGGLEIRHTPPLRARLENAAVWRTTSSNFWHKPMVRPHGFSL